MKVRIGLPQMSEARVRPALLLGLTAALAFLLLLVAAAGPALAKKKGGGSVDISNPANLPIPDAGPGDNPVGVARSTIVVGKKFKGMRIRDVNATVQLTGSVEGATADIDAQLTAPNGAGVLLFGGLSGTVTLGPLTLDDESTNLLGAGLPPAQATPGVLFAPYQGSAQPLVFPLSIMDNGPVKGTWTLTLVDISNPFTSVLNSWRLQVSTGKPFKAKQ